MNTMSEYERYVRRHFSRVYHRAHALLGDEEEAAVAAQAICLADFFREDEDESFAA